MKRAIKKLVCTLLAVTFVGGTTISCVSDSQGSAYTGPFNFHSHSLSESMDYNSSLYYVNTLDFDIADPAVIYISEGEDKGYFYAYGTCDAIGGNGFQSWRSIDLVNWESMGIAFKPDFSNTWATEHHWAPEVLYENGLYYLFYSAMATEWKGHRDYGKRMSVAISTHPAGPFVVPNGQRDGRGNLIPNNKPVFEKLSKDCLNLTVANTGEKFGRENAIDIHPFVDPVSGKKYLYFSAFAYGGGFSSANFGMEMIDWFTPKYETLTQLTHTGKLSVGGESNPDPEGGVNEGPFMWYKDGTYYLTFSVFGFMDPRYQVRQATATSPLGDFKKLKTDEGGVLISSDDLNDKIVSAGHHSFFKVEDELFIAYHTFKDRVSIAGGRALAIDPVEFVTTPSGKVTMRAMGASYSMQPLPEGKSGYKNIARSATISSNNTNEDSDVKYLNDGLNKYQWFDNVTSYKTGTGKTEIKLKWNSFKTARSVLIYNSTDYETSFVRIENIQMTYLSGKRNKTSVAKTGVVDFDWNWHLDEGSMKMRPGGAAIIEFDELPVNEIIITLTSPTEDGVIEIPEIVVLGKDNAVNYVTGFKEYSYENPEKVSAEIILNGENFSNRVGLAKGSFGFDVSNDKGDNPTISNSWGYDQYIYFKNVFANKFYAEMEITVTESKAYPFATNEHDGFPKFGMVVTAPAGGTELPQNPSTEATAFFFVDAVGFSSKTVGIVERNTAGTDWAWPALATHNPNKPYTDGNYIKMAILRDGKDFYFFVDGKVVLSYNNFTGFSEDALSVVGIRCFSTGLKAQNYFATTDDSIINSKIPSGN